MAGRDDLPRVIAIRGVGTAQRADASELARLEVLPGYPHGALVPAEKCEDSLVERSRRLSAAGLKNLRGKVRDVIRLIERDGWALVRHGSPHRQHKHPKRSGRGTIAGQPGHDFRSGRLTVF
ncbi:MAG TPA: type II toxin-antitoxin system HicA family toxin [Chloroflexota bacterium]|nr:type II toxin-antitoxin system HicA family toxin [Chloroflexota bacterium]